jgi:hypothetical protein
MTEEIDIDSLPQTETVFDQQPLTIDEHTWLQQGSFIIEQCHDGLGLPIPAGQMLTKQGGHYTLVDELTRK